VKCLTQNAETVEMIVKYHSSQKMTDFILSNITKYCICMFDSIRN
jgi:hypothetical protein